MDAQERAFLDLIASEPDNAGAKLVYADWLEEQGATGRAEFARLAHLLSTHLPHWPALGIESCQERSDIDDVTRTEWSETRVRAATLDYVGRLEGFTGTLTAERFAQVPRRGTLLEGHFRGERLRPLVLTGVRHTWHSNAREQYYVIDHVEATSTTQVSVVTLPTLPAREWDAALSRLVEVVTQSYQEWQNILGVSPLALHFLRPEVAQAVALRCRQRVVENLALTPEFRRDQSFEALIRSVGIPQRVLFPMRPV